MSQCVEPDSLGVLHTVSVSVESCTAFVMMDAATYNQVPTLASIFAVPSAATLVPVFEFAFFTPLVAYVVAWSYQTVIDFISRDD